jgi:ankyrin repeat protein
MKMKLAATVSLFVSILSCLNAQNEIPTRKVIDALKDKNCEQAFKMLPRVAGIDEKDKAGGTMLMYSAVNGCVQVAYWLLDRGAKKDFINNGEFTALYIAA